MDFLQRGFERIGQDIVELMQQEPLYVRNLLHGSNDLFNTGMIVIASTEFIHQIYLSGVDHILDKTAIGDLDIPPTIDTLEETAHRFPVL